LEGYEESLRGCELSGWSLLCQVNRLLCKTTKADTFELLVEVLDGCGAQLVEDTTHFFPNIGMGISPILRDD
jgi:hypothetical protein